MPSLRIIPCILGKGDTAVKGTAFDNWRVTGTSRATSLLQGRRDADEFVFLDVQAGLLGRAVSTELTRALAQGLRIPFAVGGGVSTIEAASELFASGADKVIVGRAARTNPELLRELVDVFGSQSIVASVDSLSPTRRLDRCELQFRGREVGIQTSIQFLQDQGVGEIILTNCELDGTMAGIDIEGIRMATDVAKVPLVVGSGVSGINCFSRSFDEGASGVFAGALFQFTSSTPDTIRAELRDAGYHVRQKIT